MFKEIVLAGVLVVTSGMAAAHDRHGHGGGMLQHSDTNKDGTVARDEFLAARERQFARFDHNSDNVIDDADRGEHAKAHGSERGSWMRAHLDADGDGKISKEEFVNGGTALFDRSDADGNGALSEQEIEAMRTKARAHAQESRKH